jgi:hypothetical protein
MSVDTYPPPATDYYQEVASGNIPGSYSVNKYGRNIEIDSGITADLWDGGYTLASGGESLTWVAPTQARQHNLASTNAGDTLLGAGARTVQVYGLPDWDTAEVSEVIEMAGAADVLTTNSYVIIHRIKVLTKGATSANIGVITATAAVDATVTALIRAGEGQTQMVVYGIPSTQTLYMGRLYGNIVRDKTAGGVVFSLQYNPEPQTEITNYVTKHTFGTMVTGTSALTINYSVPKTFTGPGILKLRCTSSQNDMDISGGFDSVLKDN